MSLAGRCQIYRRDRFVLRLAGRSAFVSLFSCCLLLAPSSPGRCEDIITGGLDELESGYSVGPNLLTNGDLISGLQGWTLNPSCFSIEGGGDNASLRLQQPCPQPFPKAENALKFPPGLYTISAEIKTQTQITVPSS